jgi:hypothetical protein
MSKGLRANQRKMIFFVSEGEICLNEAEFLQINDGSFQLQINVGCRYR